MICKECGNEILPGTLFCTNCGAKAEAAAQDADSDKTVALWDEEPQQDDDKTVVLWDEEPQQPTQNNSEPKNCPNCGSQNADDALFCVECGALLAETKPQPPTPPVVPPTMTPPPQMEQPPVQQGKQAKKEKAPKPPKQPKQPKQSNQDGSTAGKNKLPLIIGAAAAVVVLIAGAIFIISGLSGKSAANDLVYMKDNEVYMAKGGKYTPELITDSYYDDADDADDISVYSYAYSGLQYTEDGKYLFYTQDRESYEYDLYYKKAGSKDEGTKLESGISSYQAYSKDKILYLKSEKLYMSDLKDKEKIASDVNRYAISENGEYFYWCEYDDGEYHYYIQDMNLKKDEVKLKDVTSIIYMSDDYSEIYYKSDDTLYLMKDLKDKIKISSDVERACMIGSEGAQKFYYFKVEDENPYTYYDFVKDDVDESSEYSEYAEYVIEDLKGYDANISEFKVYSYSAKTDKSEEIASFFGQITRTIVNYGQSERMVLYCDIDVDAMDKWKLSDVIEEYYFSYSDISLDEAIECKMLEQGTYNLITGDKIVPISGMEELYEDAGKAKPDNFCINSVTKEIYISVYYDLDEEGSTYDLYVIPYTEEEPECRLITNDLYANLIRSEQGVYYLCDIDEDGDAGILFLNGVEIDEDVYPGNLEVTDGAIYYLKDINSDHDEGTLCVNKNGKVTEIAEDVAVYSFVPVEEGNIAYLMDYSFKKNKGDLFVFSGRKSIAVDTDVSAILR